MFNELVGFSKVMVEVLCEVIVMIELDKVGCKILNLELSWDNIDVLVIDYELSDEFVK